MQKWTNKLTNLILSGYLNVCVYGNSDTYIDYDKLKEWRNQIERYFVDLEQINYFPLPWIFSEYLLLYFIKSS